MEQQSAGLGFDVIQGERDQLGAAQGRGVAEQDDRGVADPEGRGAVDAAQDLAEVGRGERPGLANRGDPVGAAQAATDLADGVMFGRIRKPADAVHVPDRGAGDGEGLHGDSGLAAFGEVGAQHHRVRREGVEVTGVAPAPPHCPHRLAYTLRVEAARAAVTAAPIRCRSELDRPVCGWSQGGVASRFMPDFVADLLADRANSPVPSRGRRDRRRPRTGTNNLSFCGPATRAEWWVMPLWP